MEWTPSTTANEDGAFRRRDGGRETDGSLPPIRVATFGGRGAAAPRRLHTALSRLAGKQNGLLNMAIIAPSKLLKAVWLHHGNTLCDYPRNKVPNYGRGDRSNVNVSFDCWRRVPQNVDWISTASIYKENEPIWHEDLDFCVVIEIPSRFTVPKVE